MKIACLGWGSLVWDPKSIPIRGKWFDDGPLLPIEFARESNDGRITLVISKTNHHVRSLWTLMSSTNLEDAKKALAKREGIPELYIKNSIGFWDRNTGTMNGLFGNEIGEWGEQFKIDAIVWTNLKYGFKKSRDKMPSCSEIIKHLNELPYEIKKVAKEYVQKAPTQIDTEYRRQIQENLAW